jgi:DNA polymerase elongation subunit (family B)
MKKKIEEFLIKRKGYLKNSPITIIKAMSKVVPDYKIPTTKELLQKELKTISEVKSTLRSATKKVLSTADVKIIDTYNDLIGMKAKPKKRLYFDLEVSANIVFSWRIGGEIRLSPDDIIQERAIICACYKWEGSSTVHSLQWNKGDDKDLLEKFAKIIDSADEIITQNGDSFDIKWLRARCIFKLNSNKLDYMGKYLGLGEKIKTDYSLWKNIMLNNDKESMCKMVDYCKNDVILLEKVYHKLQKYCPVKRFRYSK